jgi:hypothetical protein
MGNGKGPRGAAGKTNLENLLRILPAGVVSKKLIGDLKIANAIRSCSFRDAYVKNRLSAAGLANTRIAAGF